MTLAELKTQIEGDLHRTDISAQVSTAISGAIAHYSRERFWFLEGQATIPASASQTWYTAPTDLKAFDTVLATVNGALTPLIHTHYAEIAEKDTGDYTGIPSEYAYYQDQLRFYPVPDAAYIITINYHKKLSDLSAGGSNSWTTDGSDLIRFRAEWDIYQNYLKAPENAMVVKQSEMDAYMSLLRENTGRLAVGRLRKSDW